MRRGGWFSGLVWFDLRQTAMIQSHGAVHRHHERAERGITGQRRCGWFSGLDWFDLRQ